MIIGIWRDGKRLHFIKYWEIKDYLKPNQIQYFKFLHNDIKSFKEYIIGLKSFELFSENFNYKNLLLELNKKQT
jgi:hypothetical protein